jgi:hypothetical protein
MKISENILILTILYIASYNGVLLIQPHSLFPIYIAIRIRAEHVAKFNLSIGSVIAKTPSKLINIVQLDANLHKTLLPHGCRFLFYRLSFGVSLRAAMCDLCKQKASFKAIECKLQNSQSLYQL